MRLVRGGVEFVGAGAGMVLRSTTSVPDQALTFPMPLRSRDLMREVGSVLVFFHLWGPGPDKNGKQPADIPSTDEVQSAVSHTL